MSKEKITNVKVNKAVEYPVIYSYIYEREKEDIIRLAGKFKGVRKSSRRATVEPKLITGFKIENGVGVPVYAKESGTVKPKDKKVILRGGKVKTRANAKTIKKVSRKTVKKDNHNDRE